MLKILLVILSFSLGVSVNAQTVSDIVDEVSKEGIVTILRELSGEDSTIVKDTKVLIKHRVSNIGNDLSADYLGERLESFGLIVKAEEYRDKGRNVVATQTGILTPENIYIICGHYDSTNEHGADDNASGTTAVIEVARILSQYNFDNTIIYALWDEEEIGLVGAKDYAAKAKQSNKLIKAVLNLDMIGYDSNDDGQFDIDVRDIDKSYEIRDLLISIVAAEKLDLFHKVVDPGTPASDHAAFWNHGYSGVLLGEAWSVDDVTPGYHSDNDRIDLINVDYFHNMVKLAAGYIATVATLSPNAAANIIEGFDVQIFPNPAQETVNIVFAEHFLGVLRLENIAGQKMSEQSINGFEVKLDISDLTSGNYIMIVENKTGKISTFELVKE